MQQQKLNQTVVVGDFSALEKKGSDSFNDQQDKASTMANTVTHEMNTPSGFKNIQDYLQEANLYSATKQDSSMTT